MVAPLALVVVWAAAELGEVLVEGVLVVRGVVVVVVTMG